MVFARHRRDKTADHGALTQGRALMRAAIDQAEKFIAKPEDADITAADGDEFPAAGRDFVYCRNNMAPGGSGRGVAHGLGPYTS